MCVDVDIHDVVGLGGAARPGWEREHGGSVQAYRFELLHRILFFDFKSRFSSKSTTNHKELHARQKNALEQENQGNSVSNYIYN